PESSGRPPRSSCTSATSGRIRSWTTGRSGQSASPSPRPTRSRSGGPTRSSRGPSRGLPSPTCEHSTAPCGNSRKHTSRADRARRIPCVGMVQHAGPGRPPGVPAPRPILSRGHPMRESKDELAYFAAQGPFTDPGRYAHLFDGLPAEVPALCRVVQGLVIHCLWAKAYGVEVTDERRPELEVRPVSGKLEHLTARDPRPLDVTRDAGARMLGSCRDFSVMLCGMLRHHGIPA